MDEAVHYADVIKATAYSVIPGRWALVFILGINS